MLTAFCTHLIPSFTFHRRNKIRFQSKIFYIIWILSFCTNLFPHLHNRHSNKKENYKRKYPPLLSPSLYITIEENLTFRILILYKMTTNTTYLTQENCVLRHLFTLLEEKKNSKWSISCTFSTSLKDSFHTSPYHLTTFMYDALTGFCEIKFNGVCVVSSLRFVVSKPR